MNINFPLILTSAVVITGVITLLDAILWAPKRGLGSASTPQGQGGGTQVTPIKMPVIIEYARSFFPVLLAVLIIRSFIAQPFVVPTGSLEPTVLPGDFILVNQFSFGLRLPVIDLEIVDTGKPKLGDLAVFHWPVDPKVDFVKRVAGLPGDHVVYKDKILTINGQEAVQTPVGMAIDYEPTGNLEVEEKQEHLAGVDHRILVNPNVGSREVFDEIVPPKSYFMLGDNRDSSGDSRYWGFTPEANLVGKPVMILFSWDKENYRVRWERIGLKLQ